MAGRVEIINIALARLGESPIQSLEEGTVPANVAKLLFDSARRSTLRDFNWSFALSMASLARLAETPVDFHYAFALPADCLRAIRLRGDRAFVVRGNRLLTDEGEPVLEYIADVTDETKFDAKFTEAFTYKLASELAMSVKGSSELMASYSNAYQTYITQAAAESARETRVHPSENPYVEARF